MSQRLRRRLSITSLALLAAVTQGCGAVDGDDAARVPATSRANGENGTVGDDVAARTVGADNSTPAAVGSTGAVISTDSPPPGSTSSTTATTTTSTTTIPTTTTTSTIPTTFVPTVVGPLDLTRDVVGLGFSAEGRPIFAERYGTPGGRRVLVIGVIHGNEDAGLAIIEELRRRAVPDGVELWLVDSMNPDGVANQDRHNGNDVDLNRNFPYKWGPIGQPGDGQYAGVGPTSEPETQAMVNFIEQLHPDIAIWYHQDLYVINPSTGRDGRLRARYAELTGLPLGEITGGTYTGIAATWARHELAPVDGVAFIVELGSDLSPAEATTHADAVLTVATEG